jgi:hypothetical protein
MDVRADSAIMLDDRSAVDDAVFTDDRTCVHDYPGHDDGSRSNACRRSNDSGWVNESRGQETISARLAKAPGASAVISHRDNKVAAGETLELLGAAHNLAITEGRATFRGIVVQECDALEMSGAMGDVENDFPMSSGAPDE